MRIKEFADKYGVTTREVDYWVLLHLIRCEVSEDNSYRNFGPEAEEDVKQVIIAKAMGLPLNTSNIRKLEDLTDGFWSNMIMDQIVKEETAAMKLYEMAKDFVRQKKEEA